MKVSVLKENLAKALSITGRVISTRGSLEILSNVMLKTESGRLRVSATNLEVGINYWIGGKIEKEGEITVPARLFSEVVNSISSGKIDLNMEDLNLHINSEKDKLLIKGISVDEFPLIPHIEKPVLKINAKTLKEALSLVNFAAALDESRPVLSGIYLLAEDNKLTLASTDSYRLAEKNIKLSEKVKEKVEVIVPAKALIELAHVLGDINEDINICINDNQILFASNDLEFTSRLIEGQFPNYKQIIPETNETKATVSRQDFINIIKIASLFAKENANSINLNIKSKGKIEVSANSSQIGESSSFVEATVEGKEGDISFNSKYLIDVLNNIKEQKVSFEMSGKLNPGVIKPEGDKDYTYIIMPLRS